jgi:hypothetical protein
VRKADDSEPVQPHTKKHRKPRQAYARPRRKVYPRYNPSPPGFSIGIGIGIGGGGGGGHNH